MLFRPINVPKFKREIILDISDGTEGAIKKEFQILFAIKFIGDLIVLGICLVIL